MRTTACMAVALALLCSAGAVSAQESKAPPSDLGRNAALTYWRAFAAFPELTKEESSIVDVYRPGFEPKSTPEQRADLAKRWGRALELMHEASQIPQCNWGIDYEKEGPNADLTYLAKSRDLGKAAAFRARYFWQEGKRKEAAEDLRAAVIMARQVGNDGHDTLIAVLVQIANESIVDRSLAVLMTDRESADVLASALGDLVNGSAAPLMRNATLTEKKVCLPWIATVVTQEMSDPGAAAKRPDLTPEAIRQWVDELGKQYDEVAALFGLPFQEFLAKKPALEEKIKASKNPFAGSTMLSALTGPREEEEKYRVQWAMVRAAIAIRREGEAALQKVLSPADGKPFVYTALEGGAFELKSALPIRDKQIAMTFGRAPVKKE
ncbi:MAG: hypothetical protein ACLQVA_15655 [Candidatus Brocadiia bacterium]